MQGNQGDSRLLMVGGQIGNLTPDPSFDHNLCFNFPNGSCEPILNIYIPRAFQWYKNFFNPMTFDPCNCPLKSWESQWTLTHKVGALTWECEGSFLPTLLHSREHEMWLPSSLLAFTFVSPCLSRKPKARVATHYFTTWHKVLVINFEIGHADLKGTLDQVTWKFIICIKGL
jgi:hypothetical protein